MIKTFTKEIIDDFRRVMTAFTDSSVWTDESIRLCMVEGDCATGGSSWGDFVLEDDHCFKKRGMYYYTAHLLCSYFGSDGSADPTKIKPDARLNVASKSVGDESVGYRVTAMENTSDDFLSTTIYGVMFVTLRRRASPLPFCI